MKKSNFSIVGSAIFASIFLVTASSFAVDAPVANPDNARGVSPTFSGLTVEGDVNFGNDIVTRDDDVINAGLRIIEVNSPMEFTSADAIFYGRGAAFYSDRNNPNGVIVGSNGIYTTAGGVLPLNPSGDVRIGGENGGNLIVNGDIEAAGDIRFEGNINLPIEQVSINFNNVTAGLKSHVAFCPAGLRPLSCNLYITTGHANARGTGSLVFGNGCFGNYSQGNADRVSGVVSAICL